MYLWATNNRPEQATVLGKLALTSTPNAIEKSELNKALDA